MEGRTQDRSGIISSESWMSCAITERSWTYRYGFLVIVWAQSVLPNLWTAVKIGRSWFPGLLWRARFGLLRLIQRFWILCWLSIMWGMDAPQRPWAPLKVLSKIDHLFQYPNTFQLMVESAREMFVVQRLIMALMKRSQNLLKLLLNSYWRTRSSYLLGSPWMTVPGTITLSENHCLFISNA